MKSVFIFLFAISSALSQTCWSPLREWGVCTPLEDCPPINQALLTWPRDDKTNDFFRGFLCSWNLQGTGVHVCCSKSMLEVQEPTSLPYYHAATKKTSHQTVVSDKRPAYAATKKTSQAVSDKRPPRSIQAIATSSTVVPLVLVAGASAPAQCGRQTYADRVYGGKSTGLGEFPWMALLFYRSRTEANVKHHCGGSLLNNRYVLTAGHCYGRSASLEFVRLGEYDTIMDKDCAHRDGRTFCAEPHQDIKVEKFVAHPQYDRRATPSLHDIGLIKLNRPAQYNDYVRPICLPSPQTKLVVGELVSLAGWGQSFPVKATYKQTVTLPIYDHAKCAEFYLSRKPNPFKITEAQVCAGGEFGKDGCNGDSGGPLMRVTSTGQWEVVAVTSFAQHCGNQSPGVYTGVEPYLNWIHRTMRQ